jgi:hypothetical protein
MLKLRVGGKYRARNGEVSEIYEDRRGHYRGRCADGVWNYEPNGHWCGGGGVSEHDLIAEVGLDLQAGKYYRTRDGRKAFVAAVVPPSPFGKHKFTNFGYIDDEDGVFTWGAAGHYNEDLSQGAYDLVAPWSEPIEVQLNGE